MNKRLITIFNIVFFNTIFISVPLFSQANSIIRGSVVDITNKEGLPFANVFLEGTSFGSSTDEDGLFRISNVPPGTYTLRVIYIGYKQQEKEISVESDQSLLFNFELEPEFVEGEEIVVTAQAEGQKKAINEQLSSMMIKNVVSAARIRELPDANAAESVARLPGVSLQREGGEGARVVIRGLSPQYNRITIDGVELPANSTSNDPEDHKSEYRAEESLSLTGDRATNLSMISSNMLGGIEVIKAITPDLDATVLGGIVNFSMRKAEAKASSLPKFSLTTQASHNQLKDKYNDYKLVGEIEQRFIGNSFGVFLQGSYEKKNLSANELSAPYFYEGRIDVDEEGDPEITSVTLTDVLRDRRRYGAILVCDYKYKTGNIGFLNFYSRSNTENIHRRENYVVDYDDLFNSTTTGTNELDVLSNLLSIKQDLFADFHIDLKLSHSFSRSKNPGDTRFTFWQQGAGFQDKFPILRYAPPKEIASHVIHEPEQSHFYEIFDINNISKDRTYNAAFDVTKDVVFSNYITALFKTGAAYQRRNRSYDYNESSGSLYYDEGPAIEAAILEFFPELGNDNDQITYSSFIDNSYSYGEFLNGDFTLGTPMGVVLMPAVLYIARVANVTGFGGGFKYRENSSLLYDYNGYEERSAAYAMSTIKIGRMFTVIPGVRYQNLTTSYTGTRGETIEDRLEFYTINKIVSHGYWLPMAHFRFKPLDWLQFHFAYTNTLNYPDYNTIIPRYFIGRNFILYNNYKLKPTTSENFDAIITIYSNKIGLFSFGGYKKTISNLIFSETSYPGKSVVKEKYPELYDIIKDRSHSYSLLTYINNPFDVDVWGIETEWQTHMWYLPGVLSGIVINMNYTHIFSEAQYPKSYLITYPPSEETNWIPVQDTVDTYYESRLLNQPKDIFNISLGYDYKDFSLRFSILYKDKIFKNPNFWSSNWVNSDKYTRLDLSLKQKLPWHNIQVYLNLNNLSGEDDVDIVDRTGITTSQQHYGSTVDIGLNIVL